MLLGWSEMRAGDEEQLPTWSEIIGQGAYCRNQIDYCLKKCSYRVTNVKIFGVLIIVTNDSRHYFSPLSINWWAVPYFFVVFPCHYPVLDGFDQHYQASVHCSKQFHWLTSATSKYPLEKIWKCWNSSMEPLSGMQVCYPLWYTAPPPRLQQFHA